MPTTQQIQAAIQNAQAAGDQGAVQRLTAALSQADDAPTGMMTSAPQAAQPQVDRQKLSDAIYAATDAGDQPAAHRIFTQLRAMGMTLAPRSKAAQDAAFQKINAQNVNAQPWYQNAAQGIGEGASNFWQGVKQNTYDRVADAIDGGSRVAQDQSDIAESRRLSQALNSSTAGKIGNIAGGAMSSAPLLLVPGAGEGALATAASGIGAGALGGYLAPSASSGEHVGNTVLGGVSGLVAPALGGIGKFALAGAATPAARNMLDAGVKLTPGMILGGVANRIEQALTSLPIVGDIINSARNKAMDSFNKAAINKALSPIGEALPQDIPAGQPALAWAARKASDAYENALSNTSGKLDSDLLQSLGAIRAKSDPAIRDEVQSIIQNDVLKPFAQNNGQLSGQQYQNLVSDLKQAQRGYMSKKGQTSADRQLANSYGDLIDSLDGMFSRVNGGEALDQLNAANTAYKGFSTLRDATATASRRREGVFTPGEFLDAVKKGDATKAKGNFAKGQAFMQDFGNDAQSAVGNTIGNSFTADRLNHTNTGMLLAGALGTPLAAPYVGVGRDIAQSVLAPQIGPVRGSLLSLSGSMGGYGQSRYLPILLGIQNGANAPNPAYVYPNSTQQPGQ